MDIEQEIAALQQEAKDYVQSFKEQSSRQALNLARRDNRNSERNIEALGLEPPAEQGESFLSSLLDTLDTGGQAARGAIANVLKVKGYDNESVLDSIKRGTQEDLTVGKILREKGVLKNAPLSRAALGFVGDVATDPFSYLTFGAGLGAKVAGKTAGKAALKTAGGKTVKGALKLMDGRIDDIMRSKIDDLAKTHKADDIAGYLDKAGLPDEAALVKGLDGGDEVASKLANIQIEAQKDAVTPFKEAQAFLEKKQQWKTAGVDKLDEPLKNSVNKELFEQEERIRKSLDLADDVPLEDLFAGPAIRVANPFAGLIPGINRSSDIPLITSGSEKLFNTIGKKSYGARVKIANGLDELVEFGNKQGGLPQKLAGAVQTIRSTPKLFSRNIQAGSKLKRQAVEEHEIALANLRHDISNQMDQRFSKFEAIAKDAGIEDVGEVYNDITTRLQAAAKADNTLRTQRVRDFAPEHEITSENFDDAIESIRFALNEKAPGLGDEAAELMNLAVKELRQFSDIESENGLLTSVLANYIPSAYEEANLGVNALNKAYDYGVELMSGKQGRPDFAFRRTFQTMDEGFLAKGLIPKANFKERILERTVAHHRALQQKDFFERMAYEWGLSEETHRKVAQAVASKDKRVADSAVNFLRRIDVSPKKAIEAGLEPGALEKGLPIKLRMESGEILDTPRYDHLQKVLNNPNTPPDVLINAQRQAQDLGLKFTPEERLIIEEVTAYKNDFKAAQLGRAGETVYSRAGGELLQEPMRKYINKNLKDPEAKKFFNQVLPQSLVHAINESYTQKSLIKDSLRGLYQTQPELANAAEKMIKGYTGWLNYMKLGMTHIWPAFHARNFGSAQLLRVQEASIIGEQFNPAKLAETLMIRKGKGKIVQKGTGRVISSRQLVDESRRFGLVNDDYLKMVDIIDEQGNVLMNLAKGKPFKESLGKFANFVEMYGREHLYYQLRRGGYDASSAAHRVNEIMVNYARGKTAFEKDVLNNVIFFYSFARATTVNQLTSLFSRPGNLTTQLHAVEGVKEALLDPNAIPPQDYEGPTMRGSEMLNRFIGRSESGNPLYVQGFGVPLEETANFASGFRLPKDMTIKGFMDATGSNLKRSGQLLMGQVNPALKKPLEYLVGRDFFFDRPLTDEFLRKVPKLAEVAPKLLPFGDKVPKEVWEALDPATLKMLGGRDLGDGNVVFNPFPLLIASLTIPGFDRYRSTGGFLIKDGVPEDLKYGRMLSGVRAVEVDPETGPVFDRRRQLEEFMIENDVPKSRRGLRKRLFIEEKLKEIEKLRNER